MNSAPPGTASAFYTCTADWAKAHPDAIAAFRQSLDEAGRFIGEHPDQAKQILAAYTKLPVASIEQTPLPNFRFQATPAQIQYWEDISKKQGLIDTMPDAAAMILP